MFVNCAQHKMQLVIITQITAISIHRVHHAKASLFKQHTILSIIHIYKWFRILSNFEKLCEQSKKFPIDFSSNPLTHENTTIQLNFPGLDRYTDENFQWKIILWMRNEEMSKNRFSWNEIWFPDELFEFICSWLCIRIVYHLNWSDVQIEIIFKKKGWGWMFQDRDWWVYIIWAYPTR